MKDVRSFALFSTVCVVLAFVLYAWWWSEAPLTTFDTPSYQRVAADIKQLELTRLHQRTPGYPLLLALTNSERTLSSGLFYVTLAAQLASLLILVVLLRTLGLSLLLCRIVLITGLLPPFVAPAVWATTESISTFCVVLAIVSFVLWLTNGRSLAWIVFSLSCVAAAFIRPTYQLLAPVFAVLLAMLFWLDWISCRSFARMWKHMAATVALSFGSLGAWAYVNYVHFGQFDTSTMSANAASSKVATVLEYLPDKYSPLREILIKHRDRLITEPFRQHTGQDYIYRALPEVVSMYKGDELQALNAIKEASVYLIKTKPISYLHDSVKLFGSFWMPNDYDVEPLTHGSGRTASALLQTGINLLFFIQAAVIVGVGLMVLSLRAAKRRILLSSQSTKSFICLYATGLAVTCYTMLISCFAGIGENRYRIPVDLIVIAMTAVGATLWYRMALAILSFAPCVTDYGKPAALPLEQSARRVGSNLAAAEGAARVVTSP